MNEVLRLTSPLTRSEAVKQLQLSLQSLGYGLTADGFFGKETEKIVKQFQKDKGLAPDGIVGPLTWAAFGPIPIPEPEPLKDYMILLVEWGFADSLRAIGEKETIKQFQSAMGLSADGVVGPKTMEALEQEVIVPRLVDEDLECQCVASGKNYCDGYPCGHGAGHGVLILAERIFREVEKKYPDTEFFVSSVKTPVKSGVAGGYRCVKWNKERGGAAGSKHKACMAMDIFGKNPNFSDSVVRKEIERVAMEMNTRGGVGYGAAYIVHIDTRGSKTRWKY